MTSIALGTFMHACEGEMVCKSTHDKIPYFNAPIYLENKSQIGKVEEILGPMNEVVGAIYILYACACVWMILLYQYLCFLVLYHQDTRGRRCQ